MTTLPHRLWQEMTTYDFLSSDTADWIAVLPVAAIEQHGPHLPVYTDTCIAEGQVRRVIELLPDAAKVTFLPVQAIAKSNEHLSFPGTLTIGWETVIKAWLDIGDSVARAGLSRLVIVTAHGGNVPIMDIVARELRIRHRMLVVATAWARFGQPEGMFSTEELTYGIHGGDVETSLMLHLRPDLVRMERAESFRSTQERMVAEMKRLRVHGAIQFGWQAEDLNPAGTVGEANAATPEKGAASLDHAARGFIDMLDDVARMDLATFGPAAANKM